MTHREGKSSHSLRPALAVIYSDQRPFMRSPRSAVRTAEAGQEGTLWSLLHLPILRITSGCPAFHRGDHEPVRIAMMGKTFVYLMHFSPLRSFSLCGGYDSVPGPWNPSTGSQAAFTGPCWSPSLPALRHATSVHPVLFLPQPQFSKEPSSVGPTV